jgi:hypothetical protein
MMQWRALLGVVIAGFALAFAPIATAQAKPAGSARSVTTISWVEEWDPAAQRWVRVADAPSEPMMTAEATTSSARVAMRAPGGAASVVVTETIRTAPTQFVAARPNPLANPLANPLTNPLGGAGANFIAQYGPFRVLDGTRAALVGATDVATPRQFDAMLRDYPGLAVLELIDAPGTSHDLANLALGRKIRAAGLATHVPAGGSVRSGAVELFLAGQRQTIASGASFAVHSWMDSRGLEPRHFAPDAPENRLYLDYYEEMGMSPEHARAFYAMTNSVPHSGALWLDAATMQGWMEPRAGAVAQPEPELQQSAPVIATNQALALRFRAAVKAARGARAALALAEPQPVLSPVLDWSEVGAVALARLDSAKVFP